MIKLYRVKNENLCVKWYMFTRGCWYYYSPVYSRWAFSGNKRSYFCDDNLTLVANNFRFK